MALSEEEQRLLEQLEASLAKDDPRLAHALRGTRPRPALNARHSVLGGIGFAAGLSLLVIGIQAHWSISVLGFVVMLASAIIGFGAWKPRSDNGAQHHRRDEPPQSPARSSTAFMDRLEERWRRRQDDEF